MEHKPTLLQLRRQYDLTSSQLATAANLPLYQTYTVEIGGFIQKEVAEKVVSAFSLLVKKSYTLSDIRVYAA